MERYTDESLCDPVWTILLNIGNVFGVEMRSFRIVLDAFLSHRFEVWQWFILKLFEPSIALDGLIYIFILKLYVPIDFFFNTAVSIFELNVFKFVYVDLCLCKNKNRALWNLCRRARVYCVSITCQCNFIFSQNLMVAMILFKIFSTLKS